MEPRKDGVCHACHLCGGPLSDFACFRDFRGGPTCDQTLPSVATACRLEKEGVECDYFLAQSGHEH
jgi:hypothetical protein